MSSVDSGVIFELVSTELPTLLWVLAGLAVVGLFVVIVFLVWSTLVEHRPADYLLGMGAAVFCLASVSTLVWGVSLGNEARDSNRAGAIESVESHYGVTLYSDDGKPLVNVDSYHDDSYVYLVSEGYHSVIFEYDGVPFKNALVKSERLDEDRGEVGLTLLVPSEDDQMESDGFTEFTAELVK